MKARQIPALMNAKTFELGNRLVFSGPVLSCANEWLALAANLERFNEKDSHVGWLRSLAEEVICAVEEGSHREWLTVEQFCDSTNQKPATVRGWCRRGKLNSMKKGGTFLIHVSELSMREVA